MIFLQLKDNKTCYFILKDKEREMDFVILMNEAMSGNPKVFTVTNVHNIKRTFKSKDVLKCLWYKKLVNINEIPNLTIEVVK